MVTVICDLKRMAHRKSAYVAAKLAFVAAMFNVLLRLHRRLDAEADPYDMSIATFSL
jgi:hypothetical protein